MPLYIILQSKYLFSHLTLWGYSFMCSYLKFRHSCFWPSSFHSFINVLSIRSHQRKKKQWTDQKKMKNDATDYPNSAHREMLPNWQFRESEKEPVRVHLFVRMFKHEIIISNVCLLLIRIVKSSHEKLYPLFVLESPFVITFVLVENIHLIFLFKLPRTWSWPKLKDIMVGCISECKTPSSWQGPLCGPFWSHIMEWDRTVWNTTVFFF